jgi:hypothetical protein
MVVAKMLAHVAITNSGRPPRMAETKNPQGNLQYYRTLTKESHVQLSKGQIKASKPFFRWKWN